MTFSDFIFNGKLGDLSVGGTTYGKTNLDLVQEEDGDIPGLYEVLNEEQYFQVSTIKNTIVGITFDFEYDTEKSYPIHYQENNYRIGFNTAYADFVAFLETSHIDFKSTTEEGNHTIFISESKLNLLFYNNLYKASVFDLDLYNTLTKNK
ncbi:hypothetical protein [Flavobacterium humi]|uniref:Uncharacterized protein n=1 Tax=Flavobacterium humi TaxID=2562683 RepID=A0A4Z0L3P9_9FLAO|nr:hypothetical protein [Flavobacterium humi]TGD56847.1 hypothetical protein E4635_13690 [Flavobacterium humi]